MYYDCIILYHIMRLGPNCYQIWSKTCYLPKVSNVCEEKGYILTGLEV